MYVNDTCTICGKPNDQMLMLACVHDPCINCAATAYAEQIHIKGQNREICAEETLLDNSTINYLTLLANNTIKIPAKVQTVFAKGGSTVITPSKKRYQPNQSIVLGPTSSSSKKVVYYCKEHGEYYISYYCFTCWMNICPECAIHGAHKDHEVKLIKKAISQVKEDYLEVVSKATESQTAMAKLKDSFLKMIKEANYRHTREKNAIAREFDLIRSSLQTKYKEMLRELDEVNKQNVATLASWLETVNTSYYYANKIKRSVDHITKKDEVQVLYDYRKIGYLDEALLQLGKLSENIGSTLLLLKIESLQQDIKYLLYEIGNIKLTVRKEEINGNNVSTGGQSYSRINNS